MRGRETKRKTEEEGMIPQERRKEQKIGLEEVKGLSSSHITFAVTQAIGGIRVVCTTHLH